jgi:membrane-bound serine protease (ClpP class)
MALILILFFAGVALLAIDVFVASLILAAGGAVVMTVAVALVYVHFGGTAALVAGAASGLLLIGAVYFELVVFPRTRWGRGLVAHSTSGKPSVAAPAAAIGKSATAVTTLAPSGYILVDGVRYEAFCQTGHVPVGTDLRVVGADQFRLIVAPAVPVSLAFPPPVNPSKP